MNRDFEKLLIDRNSLLRTQSVFKNSFLESSTLFSSIAKNTLWKQNPSLIATINAALKIPSQKQSIERIIRGSTFSDIASKYFPFDLLNKSLMNQTIISKAFPQFESFDNLSKSISSMQSTLGSLTSKIALCSINKSNNDLISKFERITSEASAISSDVIEDMHSVEENLNRIENFYGNALEELKDEIRRSHKSPMAIIALWINIVSILLTLYAIIEPHLKNDNSQPVNQEQLQQIRHELLKIDSTLKSISKTYHSRIKCAVRQKANNKSCCLFMLEAGKEINLLEVNHKWVKIIILNNPNLLPITGWVLKKHLK